jgi:N-methylhydantoinase B/oxoprolinase/acetone carboxylase alpha subunit
MISHTDFPAGSSLRVSSGGGDGHPAEHEPELIRAHLADGYVTPEATSAQYGHGGAR